MVTGIIRGSSLLLREITHLLGSTLGFGCCAIFQNILYVNPTQSQRFYLNSLLKGRLAYQKVVAGFDNRATHAIIREQYTLNGHRRPNYYYPF